MLFNLLVRFSLKKILENFLLVARRWILARRPLSGPGKGTMIGKHSWLRPEGWQKCKDSLFRTDVSSTWRILSTGQKGRKSGWRGCLLTYCDQIALTVVTTEVCGFWEYVAETVWILDYSNSVFNLLAFHFIQCLKIWWRFVIFLVYKRIYILVKWWNEGLCEEKCRLSSTRRYTSHCLYCVNNLWTDILGCAASKTGKRVFFVVVINGWRLPEKRGRSIYWGTWRYICCCLGPSP